MRSKLFGGSLQIPRKNGGLDDDFSPLFGARPFAPIPSPRQASVPLESRRYPKNEMVPWPWRSYRRDANPMYFLGVKALLPESLEAPHPNSLKHSILFRFNDR